MTNVTVQLTDEQAKQLAHEAQKLGIAPEDLLRAAVVDLIEGPDEAFLQAARHVVAKNSELYQRLS